MSAAPWEFWIDVGGTFTDCLGKSPTGELKRHKLLSSGITKGTVSDGSTLDCLVDPARKDDPADFWDGYRVALLDGEGQTIAESQVATFDPAQGALYLRGALPSSPSVGTTFELSSELEAPVVGIRYLLGLANSQEVPPIRLRLGTTRGTNALLTRTGARTVLVTTKGFGDLLEIGYQDRPKLFELTVKKPKPLTETSIEIEERLDATGKVLTAPNEREIKAQLKRLYDQGIESLAICLLHADLNADHERMVANLAREIGFTQISCSSEVAPLVKIVARAETTVVDAYLTPVLREYLRQLQCSLPSSQIRLMTSAGGLVTAEAFRGHESVLSGPAGGVVGYAQAAKNVGFKQAIGFDMGGTSTDVSRFNGKFEFEYETRKAGVRLMSPTLAIDTVAAGGGSICKFDGSKLIVGPASAGADPGPACYGRGGPLCVTDLNFYLGRIAVERFPFTLDSAAVEKRLADLAQEVFDQTGEQLSPVKLADGLLQIANSNMALAVRGVSIAKGVDPANYLMVSFGGAAAQHACAVAQELGIRQILNHPDAGILSAYGIGCADVVRHAAKGVAKLSDEVTAKELETIFKKLSQEPMEKVLAEGIVETDLTILYTLDLRYQGTEATLSIDFEQNGDLNTCFADAHQQRYGYRHEGRSVEIVAARVEVIGGTQHHSKSSQRAKPRTAETPQTQKCFFAGEDILASVFDRAEMRAGDTIAGPAIVSDLHSTIIIEPNWQAEMLTEGELLITSTECEQTAFESSHAVMLELFNNQFAGIAEQMGHVLQRTALSVNVKERLDFSCAVFSAKGELIANAPHVPVHLGAMGATVKAVLTDFPTLYPGDVVVTNDPYRGGSHLPDVTVVTPVHSPTSGELIFFTACRAHHAEIGGVCPGSMPPNSASLEEEGVLISNFELVRNGVSHESELRDLLFGDSYPSRRVEENLADIQAQVAANQQGARDLLELVDRHSLPTVQGIVSDIQAAAEMKVRQALQKLGKQKCEFTDYLETADGEETPIQVLISLCSNENEPAAVIDFTGTGPVVDGNLNANRAIVTAAVLYVLRLLVDEDIPLNEGALRAVEIILPKCFLNPPKTNSQGKTPAVAAGNVETSQRVVDVLLGAFGVAGASQGTMNNLLFGDDSFGYYETICGGAGATAEGPGANAVQVHMTNTRATDPEILERRHPVRLHEFSIRRNSGGQGKHPGGNGVTRRLEFLKPLELSLITQRRGQHPPYGMADGESGSLGENRLIHSDGTVDVLPSICQRTVNPGETLVIETPGGGGYGKPD